MLNPATVASKMSLLVFIAKRTFLFSAVLAQVDCQNSENDTFDYRYFRNICTITSRSLCMLTRTCVDEKPVIMVCCTVALKRSG